MHVSLRSFQFCLRLIQFSLTSVQFGLYIDFERKAANMERYIFHFRKLLSLYNWYSSSDWYLMNGNANYPHPLCSFDRFHCTDKEMTTFVSIILIDTYAEFLSFSSWAPATSLWRRDQFIGQQMLPEVSKYFLLNLCSLCNIGTESSSTEYHLQF